MWKVIQKISQVIREEMNKTGAQECLLPQLQPAELWHESGRWDDYHYVQRMDVHKVISQQYLTY